MATFKEHIEGLTGLSIGTSPTDDELSSFLNDGIREVVGRIIVLKPEEIDKFTKSETGTFTGIEIHGKITSVMREHDSAHVLRKCDEIHSMDRYDAEDEDSLHYRSKSNPAWYILDQKIFTVPEASNPDNRMIVNQVKFDTSLKYDDTYNYIAINWFADEYEYLVAQYASIK